MKHEKQLSEAMARSLKHACSNGCLAVVQALVSNGANIHSGDDQALINAYLNEQWDICKFLMENGANIKVLDLNPKGLLELLSFFP